MRSCGNRLLVSALVAVLSGAVAYAQRSNASQLYAEAMTRETALRREIDALKDPARGAALLQRTRVLVGTYEDIARLFPASGYSDNALWQGGMLAADAFWAFGEAADRGRAIQLLNALTTRFPASSRVREVPPQIARLTAATATPSTRAAGATRPAPEGQTASGTPVVSVLPPPPTPAVPPRATPGARPDLLQSIRRESLPGVLRITLELERETTFQDERIEGPPRVFIDLQSTRSVEVLDGATLAYTEDVVRQVRVGRQLGGRTRVVFDLAGAARHSVYTLYNPFRIVIDFERASGVAPAFAHRAPEPPAPGTVPAAITSSSPAAPLPSRPVNAAVVTPPPAVAAASVSRTIAAPAVPEPKPLSPPVPNSKGGLSLSRQLGLGVARIVIDPGHGGHDPGARTKGLSEAELVLDVALRLEKLLMQQPGVEVVLTRRTNVYVPLEERTALANREEADLFLSIHVNASDDPRARGIETYFLNFAPNKQAEAIAARENAGSIRTMRNLPDIVKAIALSDKIEESRDFASMIQTSMVERLRKANRASRNLGVKQAPFVVLIGATMPSVLAELPFLTNDQEGAWLKAQGYRQQIAEALLNGVMTYQRSLKGTQVAAGTR